MLRAISKKLFGSRNERVIRSLRTRVAEINAREKACQALKDEDFPAQANRLRQRLEQGEKLDALLPESFALVREASVRTLGLRHFDVQLIGGMVLHGGSIAEMKTGEGKTLVATLAAFLHALSGKGVHVVTVNDYLARRDAEWMGDVYRFLGMEVGVIVSGMEGEARRKAYQADITYGTNNEFGFDYLRDNMVFTRDARVMRELNYAIVDEVDSVLIDEARTPLIISGAVDDRTDLYTRVDAVVKKLYRKENDDADGDYSVDEKSKQVFLSEQGHDRLERLLRDNGLLASEKGLYDAGSLYLLQYVQAALRAHTLYQRDVEYIVKQGKVVIVDEFTGRTMEGRRWGEGLHQAIEAKEGVPIEKENQTLASITYQNYFRMYERLSGMTGTADTEAQEFHQIYGLEVVVIPTHNPMIRDDESDLVFMRKPEKYETIIEDIKSCRERQQPVLVGTVSIEVSELLSEMLRREKIPHKVLNAKFHEKEAEIIAQAGRPGAVTIATNMAGRGTDIVLGGNYQAELQARGKMDKETAERMRQDWQQSHDAVVVSGGLRIIGTERHESRRIDNQLRGRSGRQGDPGSSRFYVSLDDNLLRIFASEWVGGVLQKMGMENEVSIESKLLTRSIENAQCKVEAHHFDVRKHLLQYDDVANEQRKVIYSQRDTLLDEAGIAEDVKDIRREVIDGLIDGCMNMDMSYGMLDDRKLEETLERELGMKLDIVNWYQKQSNLSSEELYEYVQTSFAQYMEAREKELGTELMRALERHLMLDMLDRNWKEHLATMDYLRQGIHLRGMAAKNPAQEYKKEAFVMFMDMLGHIKYEFITILSRIRVKSEEDMAPLSERKPVPEMQYTHPAAAAVLSDESSETGTARRAPRIRAQAKIGRNEPCPCGSGKKYKHCCGRL